MAIFFELFGIALIPVTLSIIFGILDRTVLKNMPYWPRQILIGIVFGVAAIFGTEYGVDIGGATANARDAAPLCAGLLFGGPAGIISGLIGAVERWFAVYWGAGEYSRIACTVATGLAGFYAAFLRQFIFERKRPDWLFGFATGIVMEVVHMTTLFLTHLSDAEQSFRIVKICTMPMLLCNAASVMLAVIALSVIDRIFSHGADVPAEADRKDKGTGAGLARTIRTKLLISIVIAYCLTSSFTYIIQTGTAENDVKTLLANTVSDMKAEISKMLTVTDDKARTAELLHSMAMERHVSNEGRVIICDSRGSVLGSGFESDIVLTDDEYFMLEDELEGYRITAAISKEEAYFTRDAGVYLNSFMQIVVYAALFMLIYIFIRQRVVGNVYSVNESLQKIIDGNLDEKVEVYDSAEFASLSDDINSTVAALKQYTIDAENRYKKELEFAKSIQHSAIPNVFPPFPDQNRFDVFATMDTAKEVGGDFYDFYMLGENKLAMTIADVSGKGVPAAMFMMTAKTTLRNLAMTGMPVEKVLERASNSLCEGNEADMFVTCWFGILDLRNGHVTYANAGHNPPVIYRKGKGFEYLEQKANLVLACVPDMEYTRQTLTLEPGDRIFLYTDGVTEATSVDDRLYGEDRLKSFLNANCDRTASDILKDCKADIDAFAGEREQFDDITMMLVDYYGNEQ